MFQPRTIALAFALLFPVAASFASEPAIALVAAKQANVLTPHKVAEIKNVSAASISPDGAHVAYTLSVPRKTLEDDDGANWSELWIVARAGGEPRCYVSGKSDVANVQWLPDSSGVVFASKRGDDKFAALYSIALAGGEARRALTASAAISAYALHPDGKRIAFVSTDADSDARKKTQEKGFKQEIYEEDVKFARLFLATLFDTSTKPRALEIEGSLHQVEWNPRGETLLVTVSPTPLIDDEYMQQQVLVVSETDGAVKARFEHAGKQGAVHWSRDGQRVAMLAAADINDPSDGRLFVAAATGGKLTDLTAGKELDVDAFDWHPDGHLFALVSQGLASSLVKLAADGSDWKTLTPAGAQVFTAFSLSDDGENAAFVASTPAHPAELFTMSHGDTAPLRRTTSNPWLAEIALAPQEAITWKARDGLELQGVLVHPLNEVKGQRYPLILYVHGGPEAHEQNGWQTAYAKPGQVAAARGFAVFYPNYRGSTGRGLAFSKLSQGDPAGKEFDDLVDAVDHLVSLGLADKAKVGVTGGSYGGYATAWCATKLTDRFAAGVMFVGISDKISKVGTTDIPNEEFHVHALHRVWDDWNFFLDRSPIKYAGDAKTPLLILHGKDDPRVNPGQSRELYRHLKLRGKAPVRLVLYPGEGHGNKKCAGKLDYNLRMIQWFEHYLTGAGGAAPAWELDYAAPVAATN